MGARHEELQLNTDDGLTLVGQRWIPDEGQSKAEVLILHGYAEHSDRYRELAHVFASRGITTVAVDLRGHGRSPGKRGHVDRFEEYHADVSAALGALQHPTRFVLGHSMGGLLALDIFAREAHGMRGVVITSPFLDVATPIPEFKAMAARILGTYLPTLALPSGLDAAGLSHDQDVVNAYKRDSMVFSTATGGWLREAQRAQQRVRALQSSALPMLFVYGDADPIVSPAANRDMAEKLAGKETTVVVRHGELHEVLNEVNRAELHDRVATWLEERIPAPA